VLSLAWVITLSATRRSSLAFGRVVTIRSWVIRDVTMLRSMAHLWDDVLPNLRNAMRFFIVELGTGRRQVTSKEVEILCHLSCHLGLAPNWDMSQVSLRCMP